MEENMTGKCFPKWKSQLELTDWRQACYILMFDEDTRLKNRMEARNKLSRTQVWKDLGVGE